MCRIHSITKMTLAGSVMKGALESILKSLIIGVAVIVGIGFGYHNGIINNNGMLCILAVGAISYFMFMQKNPTNNSSSCSTDPINFSNEIPKEGLLENLVAKMLVYRDNPDPETVRRVQLAFQNGVFRDAGFEAPARAWLAGTDCSYGSRGRVFYDTVECAELAYAASGSEQDREFFEVLCNSKNDKIRKAAERAVQRRKLAEQTDRAGELLTLNGTLRGQHTSLLE